MGDFANVICRGWRRTPLVEVCDVIQGQSPPGKTYNTDGVGLPFFQGKAEFGDYYPTAVKWCTEPKKIAEGGDVLISIRAPVGPTNLCSAKSCIGRGLAALRPKAGVPSKYLLYAIRASVGDLVSKATGSTFEAVSGNDLRAHEISLAPEEERDEIVAEIEKQFTRLEAGVAGLRRVQVNLKRYRAAVLKAACEGKLGPTEAELARQEGRSYETGAQLLDRILTERRKKWNGKGKYRQPAAADVTNLPKLPEGWEWGSIEQISAEIVDCPHSTPSWTTTGRICVRTTDFLPGRLDLGDVRYVSNKTYQERVARLQPQGGDILYSREGGILGIACQIPFNLTLCMGQRMMLIRAARGVTARLIMHWLNSPFILSRVKELTTGSASPHLNVGDVRSFAVPIPPTAEQQRIAAEMERRLSVVEELEAVVNANLQRAARLRQSMLKRAFEGTLVP